MLTVTMPPFSLFLSLHLHLHHSTPALTDDITVFSTWQKAGESMCLFRFMLLRGVITEVIMLSCGSMETVTPSLLSVRCLMTDSICRDKSICRWLWIGTEGTDRVLCSRETGITRKTRHGSGPV